MQLEMSLPPPRPKASKPRQTSQKAVRAWRAWLGALAKDAEAALAAAMAYRALSAVDREAWLESLEQDGPEIDVPRIAVYAPLLSVETDPGRRARMQAALLACAPAVVAPKASPRALLGTDESGRRVAVIIFPLYMDFVEVLACQYQPGRRVDWVRHDPIANVDATVRPGSRVADTALEERPLKGVVDELATAIVAHNRSGREVPAALRAFAHLFNADFAR